MELAFRYRQHIPDVMYHGTNPFAWQQIAADQMLVPGGHRGYTGRRTLHFSAFSPESGLNPPPAEMIKKNYEVTIVIDLHFLIADEHRINLAPNGDIIMYDNVPLAYVKMAYNNTTGEILYIRGFHVDASWTSGLGKDRSPHEYRKLRTNQCIVCDDHYPVGINRCSSCNVPVHYTETIVNFKECDPGWEYRNMCGNIRGFDKDEIKSIKHSWNNAMIAKRNRLWIGDMHNLPSTANLRMAETRSPAGMANFFDKGQIRRFRAFTKHNRQVWESLEMRIQYDVVYRRDLIQKIINSDWYYLGPGYYFSQTCRRALEIEKQNKGTDALPLRKAVPKSAPSRSTASSSRG